MKVHMTLIDNKGFIHFFSAKSKGSAIKSLNTLKEGTEINWTSPNTVFVSQQYLKRSCMLPKQAIFSYGKTAGAPQ